MPGFPPVYRMPRCRHCPYHCKPCLTIGEAEYILEGDWRRTFEGTDLCQQCHQKSNNSANNWLLKKKELAEKAMRRANKKRPAEEVVTTRPVAEIKAEIDRLMRELLGS